MSTDDRVIIRSESGGIIAGGSNAELYGWFPDPMPLGNTGKGMLVDWSNGLSGKTTSTTDSTEDRSCPEPQLTGKSRWTCRRCVQVNTCEQLNGREPTPIERIRAAKGEFV